MIDHDICFLLCASNRLVSFDVWQVRWAIWEEIFISVEAWHYARIRINCIVYSRPNISTMQALEPWVQSFIYRSDWKAESCRIYIILSLRKKTDCGLVYLTFSDIKSWMRSWKQMRAGTLKRNRSRGFCAMRIFHFQWEIRLICMLILHSSDSSERKLYGMHAKFVNDLLLSSAGNWKS